jgi:hypothetical protein
MISCKVPEYEKSTHLIPANTRESFNHLLGLSLTRSSYLTSVKTTILLLSTGPGETWLKKINIDVLKK